MSTTTTTRVRLGYVAMSVHVQNASASQTMTYKQFQKLEDRQAAIGKLERIARSNLHNCLRLLKHNLAHDIDFFRLSSRLIPLATHEALADWHYISPLQEDLQAVGTFAREHDMRLDFHPDHFVALTSPKTEVVKQSMKVLHMHYRILNGMGIDPTHRCVMHVGGAYQDKPSALERFVENWAQMPYELQRMIMLENDDKTYDVQDTLYLCEKLNVPLVFDLHHHLAHHRREAWLPEWERIVQTWVDSPLPVKMHISSPKNEKAFRSHADYIDPSMFLHFLQHIKGSVPQIDCMIEAKQKDDALFALMEKLSEREEVEKINGATVMIT